MTVAGNAPNVVFAPNGVEEATPGPTDTPAVTPSDVVTDAVAAKEPELECPKVDCPAMAGIEESLAEDRDALGGFAVGAVGKGEALVEAANKDGATPAVPRDTVGAKAGTAPADPKADIGELSSAPPPRLRFGSAAAEEGPLEAAVVVSATSALLVAPLPKRCAVDPAFSFDFVLPNKVGAAREFGGHTEPTPAAPWLPNVAGSVAFVSGTVPFFEGATPPKSTGTAAARCFGKVSPLSDNADVDFEAR